MVKVKPWGIQENAAGFVYVIDYDGKKICTVYGDAETRMKRALAISEVPVLVAMLAGAAHV